MNSLNAKLAEHRLQQIKEIQERIRLKEGLPHLYSFKWYPWARKFFESDNKINLLCAANQVSKSSTQIRKCIDWATDKKKWPSLWNRNPVQFWYFYPSQKIVNAEFETKWKQFLPRGEFKDDPIYGWTLEKDGKNISAIHFFSGVHLYFKTYAQDVSDLQSGTLDAIFCDEEMPFALYSELMFRISASNGYFHMVFTATLGQDPWRRAMELESLTDDEEEFLPEAFKQCVSLYECQIYEDGSSSHWSELRIREVIARCADHNEILRRVMGRFVIEKSSLKYPTFDYVKHMKDKHQLPSTWSIYGGVDYGSGDDSKGKDKEGKDKEATGHPAAIVFVGVDPTMRKGRVFLAWRGDGITTTAGDIVVKYENLVESNKLTVTEQVYDWASADFFTIAEGRGLYFEKANKSHEVGEGILNTLFKNDMLLLYRDPETEKLAKELTTLKNKGKKRHAKDDLTDALRYVCAQIPWDFSHIGVLPEEREVTELEEFPKLNSREQEIAERRARFESGGEDAEDQAYAEELAEWNDAYGN